MPASSPHSSSSPAPASSDSGMQISSLKRRLATAQSQIVNLSSGKPARSVTSLHITLGRGIRRLISLFDSVNDLIDEADRRIQVDDDLPNDTPADALEEEDVTRNRDRLYTSYQLLLRVVPELKAVLEDALCIPESLSQFIAQLQIGANDARSDDMRRIKQELACWLDQDLLPSPPLDVRSRSDRGLQNDFTGHLLCPIDIDWDNELVRADVRSCTLDISDNYFLWCLYPKGHGDPDNLERNFLRSGWLLKTYCAIFTSPSSCDAFEADSDQGPARKKRMSTTSQRKATKSNVSSLLKMESKVTPRSIAYAAVLLVFNLTNAPQWTEVYNGFNYRMFYNFIVDFFEVITPGARDDVDALLAWWNRQIFPDRATVTSNARASNHKLAEQRARRELERQARLRS